MKKKHTAFDREAYKEFERKMRIWEDGPFTTNFAQLTAAGIELPAPDTIADDRIRAKVWEVIGELAKRHACLNHTDHLSDRELYAKLWNDLLQEEVADVDLGGDFFHVLRPDDEADMKIYLKYFADDTFRSGWLENDPEFILPERETPPFNRDALLPPNHVHGWPEASSWLAANWISPAFAANRFATTQAALDFVEQLYAAGAEGVVIDNMCVAADLGWAPYADTLIVSMPEGLSARRTLMKVIRSAGRPDEIRDEPLRYLEQGPKRKRLRWS